jgi:hypothetical protein
MNIFYLEYIQIKAHRRFSSPGGRIIARSHVIYVGIFSNNKTLELEDRELEDDCHGKGSSQIYAAVASKAPRASAATVAPAEEGAELVYPTTVTTNTLAPVQGIP